MRSSNEEKLLTVAVPAYNAERFLEKALTSLCVEELLPYMEVLIIDDGSTDATADIAHRFTEHWPDSFFLIQKENGGHGSGINVALEKAHGKYFKVLDADDWFEKKNLTVFLEKIAKTEADVVINSFETVDADNGNICMHELGIHAPEETVDMDRFMTLYSTIRDCCSFHGVTYKTELCRASGHRLTEGVYYDDQEYATVYFAGASSVLLLPFVLYCYRIGDVNQSVSAANQVRNFNHVLAILNSILNYWNENEPFPHSINNYFRQKTALLAASAYAIALIKNPDKNAGRAQAKRVTELLQANRTELIAATAKKRRTMILFSAVGMTPQTYQRLLDSRLYRKIRDLWLG